MKYYSFEGNIAAEKAVDNTTLDDLNTENGMDVLFDALDKVFKIDDIQEDNEVYNNFMHYEKPEDLSMREFLVEFDHRYQKMKKHKMELPDTVLVLKLLDSSKVTGDERKLCLTVTKDNTYDGMKAAIKQVFLKSVGNNASHSGISVKSEEAFYNYRQKGSHKQNQRSYNKSFENYDNKKGRRL